MDRRIAKLLGSKPFVKELGINPGISPLAECETVKFLDKFGDNNHNAFKRLVWFIKYDLDDYVGRMIQSKQIGPKQTLESLKIRYGDIEGEKRWQLYCSRQSITNLFEYKQQTYGWTTKEFQKYNSSRATTLNNLVSRHGEAVGLKKWEGYCERQRYTNTLEYFIERDGSKEKGSEAWLEYNYQKASSNRIPDVAERLGLTLDEAAALVSSRRTASFVSEAEKVFVSRLEEYLGEKLKYTFQTQQFCIWSPAAQQPFFYDVCCSKRMKIIEFNGDYWHANPLKYKPEQIINQVGKTASQIWEHDQIKISAAAQRGFSIMTVWESEFIQDRNILERITTWLNT